MIGADMVGRKGDLPLRTARLPENGMGKSQRLFGTAVCLVVVVGSEIPANLRFNIFSF